MGYGRDRERRITAIRRSPRDMASAAPNPPGRDLRYDLPSDVPDSALRADVVRVRDQAEHLDATEDALAVEPLEAPARHRRRHAVPGPAGAPEAEADSLAVARRVDGRGEQRRAASSALDSRSRAQRRSLQSSGSSPSARSHASASDPCTAGAASTSGGPLFVRCDGLLLEQAPDPRLVEAREQPSGRLRACCAARAPDGEGETPSTRPTFIGPRIRAASDSSSGCSVRSRSETLSHVSGSRRSSACH